jgi:hypothetical protein
MALQSSVRASRYISAAPCQITPCFTCLADTFRRLQLPINIAKALDKASDIFGR